MTQLKYGTVVVRTGNQLNNLDDIRLYDVSLSAYEQLRKIADSRKGVFEHTYQGSKVGNGSM